MKVPLQCGDVLLFASKNTCCSHPFSSCVRCWTKSKYSHVGLVLRDPPFVAEGLDGLYIWESTAFRDIPDAESKKIDFGVQVRPLPEVVETYHGEVYVRRHNFVRTPKFFKDLSDLYEQTKHLPYDVEADDLFRAFVDWRSGDVQESDAFFCSAFVTFVFVKLGMLPPSTPWTLVRPKEFGLERGRRDYVKGLKLGPLEKLCISKRTLWD